jgi:hypothetical protein
MRSTNWARISWRAAIVAPTTNVLINATYAIRKLTRLVSRNLDTTMGYTYAATKNTLARNNANILKDVGIDANTLQATKSHPIISVTGHTSAKSCANSAKFSVDIWVMRSTISTCAQKLILKLVNTSAFFAIALVVKSAMITMMLLLRY